jgi:hypothetical protein
LRAAPRYAVSIASVEFGSPKLSGEAEFNTSVKSFARVKNNAELQTKPELQNFTNKAERAAVALPMPPPLPPTEC